MRGFGIYSPAAAVTTARAMRPFVKILLMLLLLAMTTLMLVVMLAVHMSIYQPLTSSSRKRRQQTMLRLRRDLFRFELADKHGKI